MIAEDQLGVDIFVTNSSGQPTNLVKPTESQ